jgi:hypothetical protein
VKIIRYDDVFSVDDAVRDGELMFAVILFDGSEAIVCHADEAGEHYILLQKAGRNGTDIDKYFRIVFDAEGADWTFVCPEDYKNISDKTHRIAQFYKDGFKIISEFMKIFGYFGDINIPKRYRRHLKFLIEN